MSTSDAERSVMIVLDKQHDPGDPNKPCWDGDPDAEIWALYEVRTFDDGESTYKCHGSGMTYDQAFQRAVDMGLGRDEHWVTSDGFG